MKDQQNEMTDAEMKHALDNPTPGIQYPANKVQDGLKALQAVHKIDAEGADLIFWLYNYAQDNKLTLKEMGEVIGMSQTVAFHLLRCDYGAKYDSVIEAIRKAKKRIEEESKKKSIGFVKTWTASRIFDACDAALYDHMPEFIYGVSQSGKTTALLEYQRTHNHGTTKYMRMGSHWSKARTVMELAIVCRCYSNKATTAQLEHRILDSLTDRNLLIVDEFHEALFTSGQVAALEVMEFLRELYDRTGCGIVMSATPMGLKDFEQGKNAVAFDQFRRRGLVKIVLPDVPKVADINKFAKSFELPVPEGDVLKVIKQMLRSDGLGKFVKYLQKAYALATGEKRPLAWSDFAAVCNGYAALSQPKNEY